MVCMLECNCNEVAQLCWIGSKSFIQGNYNNIHLSKLGRRREKARTLPSQMRSAAAALEINIEQISSPEVEQTCTCKIKICSPHYNMGMGSCK